MEDETLEVLLAGEKGEARLLAPDSMEPEFFNVLWQQHRRKNLSLDEVGEYWSAFQGTPLYLTDVHSLVGRAARITTRTGAIIYDALFVALAETEDGVMVTADETLLKVLEGTPHAGLALSLAAWEDLT